MLKYFRNFKKLNNFHFKNSENIQLFSQTNNTIRYFNFNVKNISKYFCNKNKNESKIEKIEKNFEDEKNSEEFNANINLKTNTNINAASQENEINLIEEFEKMMINNEDNQEKRVKYLSIRLLQCTNHLEVLTIFNEKYLRGLLSKVYCEELTLILYFYTSLVEKDNREENTRSI
jgi:hypothetical protein